MRRIFATTALAGVLVTAAPAVAHAVEIHAHRGGSYANGVPVFAENTLPAFRNAARRGWVLELDVKLTKDSKPLVIHDVTLDRTTACSGEVRARTLAEIRKSCPADVLGSPGSGLPSAPAADPVRLPTLGEVLRLVRKTGATANIEIKNVPNDADFDLTNRYADVVIDTVRASRVKPDRLILQSFWPPNLDRVKERLPGVPTSFLTLEQMNAGGPAFAFARGYDWLSPAYASDFPLVVAGAHGFGLPVVPYTLNAPADVAAAAAAGTDAVITDDPPMAATQL
jgi:glycerophosphoryl diester phosphodiesterase